MEMHCAGNLLFSLIRKAVPGINEADFPQRPTKFGVVGETVTRDILSTFLVLNLKSLFRVPSKLRCIAMKLD